MQYAKSLILLSLSLLLLNNCGRKKQMSVAEYFLKVKPFIQQVSAFEVELHQKVGSSGQATGQNLAEAMEAIRPRLQDALREFEKIQPPDSTASFHRDMKKLMTTRLEAYDTTIKGRQLEVASNDTSLYNKAEQQLREANRISLDLNQEIKKFSQYLNSAQKPASP